MLEVPTVGTCLTPLLVQSKKNNGNNNFVPSFYGGNFLFPSLPQSKPNKPSLVSFHVLRITPNIFWLNKPCYIRKKRGIGQEWFGGMREWRNDPFFVFVLFIIILFYFYYYFFIFFLNIIICYVIVRP